MEQGQDTPWTRSTEHINIQKEEDGQQTQKLEHLSSTRLMDLSLRTMSQAGMLKQTVSWRQWLSLKNPIQGYLKTLVLKQWRLSNKQEWTN
ncbi:PB1-F2 protein [Influenza A virus (A/swine/France/CotesdArmor-0292/2011(H1N1))]|uniref:Protein PB1-F2 n=3 Tax=Influenza A virus TaxID=11320 RepID=A0A0K0NAU5_9INFA|nr:PB1-F2 protein [Influenza A virus (A/swine/France/Vendee-0301/2011(H1N2))]AKJ80567.1 PB1-F2 protein [Influenza A virus (A/swine/France/LoireAtlantique-0405/2011(H1N1))]AKJ81279.1 PB1-F2 protein [Influenza A virus (A/swine/France/CotesdArmor-0292/2011(H1N1))]